MNEWAILDISYLDLPSLVTISVHTQTPCHLTIHFTDIPPVTHKATRTLRGVDMPWGAYFCLVATTPLDQQEAGDTLIHTFVFPDWIYCETRWFTFRGTVAGSESPSVGPIFEHHNASGILTLYENWQTGPYGGYAYDNLWQAQTFTPHISHTLTRVSFYGRRWRFPGICNVAIRDTNPAGEPIPPDLTSQSFDGDTLPAVSGWIDIEMATLIHLDAYTKYALLLRAPNGDTNNLLVWLYHPWFNPPGYPWGQLLYSLNGGGTWIDTPNDHRFKEWGFPP